MPFKCRYSHTVIRLSKRKDGRMNRHQNYTENRDVSLLQHFFFSIDQYAMRPTNPLSCQLFNQPSNKHLKVNKESKQQLILNVRLSFCGIFSISPSLMSSRCWDVIYGRNCSFCRAFKFQQITFFTFLKPIKHTNSLYCPFNFCHCSWGTAPKRGANSIFPQSKSES